MGLNGEESMNDVAATVAEPQSIFERLAARGITALEYEEIKRIVVFHLPDRSMYFEQHFRGHTPAQTLRRAWKFKKLLKRDFILRPFLSEERIRELSRAIEGAELFAWFALLEMSFPSVGEWEVHLKCLSTQNNLPAGTAITAVHQTSGETRTTVMPSARDGRTWTQNLEQAFTDLKLLNVVLRTRRQKPLVSADPAKGWPVFTQFVVPALYEFMLRFYRKPGHSGPIDTEPRNAHYPHELFVDMLEILQMEHPHVFRDSTTAQLTASVQRYRGQLTY